MTNPFRAGRRYDPLLDVRDYGDLIQRFSEPVHEGVVSMLIAPRRSGKSWSLEAIAAGIKRGVRILNLRQTPLDETAYRDKDIVLCDEPGKTLGDDGGGAEKLLAFCRALHDKGARVVLALTPREYGQLRAADTAWRYASPKEECFLPAVRGDAGRKLMERDARALRAFDALPARWRKHPCLLEMLGEVCCDEGAPSDGHECMVAVVANCGTTGAPYLHGVFNDSLTDAQRAVLRHVARGQQYDHHGDDARLLLECGLLVRGARSEHRLGDPVLAAKLEPLRIHHVSDIHVGPKSDRTLDVGAGATLAALGNAAGQGLVHDRYVHRLTELEATGEAPHVVVISGDLVEWATPTQYAEFAAWLERVRTVVRRVEHPCLSEKDPRVLVVGGNHDVNWTEASKSGSERTRHQALADALGDVPHPHLELAPETRGAQQVTYEEMGVAFALLGSAELGGQVHEHSVTAEGLDALKSLDAGLDAVAQASLAAIRDRLASDPVHDLMQWFEALPATEREARRQPYTSALSAVARIDPGLVHDAALRALREVRWSTRVAVKIAVLHHPLSPLAGPELRRHAGLLNAAAVKKTLLDGRFSLALHGHAHTGWLAEEAWLDGGRAWTLRILSAPSLASSEVRERHGYNVIEVWPDLHGDGKSAEKQVVVRRVVHDKDVWKNEAAIGPFAPGALAVATGATAR